FTNNLAHRVNHSLLLRAGHPWKHWERNRTRVRGFCIGQLSSTISVGPLIKRVQVQGNEVDAGPDSPLFHLLHKLVSVQLDKARTNPEDEQVPCMALGILAQRRAVNLVDRRERL